MCCNMQIEKDNYFKVLTVWVLRLVSSLSMQTIHNQAKLKALSQNPTTSRPLVQS